MADKLIRRVGKSHTSDLRVSRGEYNNRPFIAVAEWCNPDKGKWRPRSGRQITFPPRQEIARQLAIGILEAVGDEEAAKALEPFCPKPAPDHPASNTPAGPTNEERPGAL